MNVNPAAKAILCYGDSNTYGQSPEKKERFASNVRWTGILQRELGNDYYVIEEGLSSRTTNLEYTRKPGRNGKTYLEPCLDSHGPLHTVILMLGTNDLKTEFNRSPQQIGAALQELIDIIVERTSKTTGQSAKIILVSPVHIKETKAFLESLVKYYDHTSVEKSQQLAIEIKKIAVANSCTFINAADIATPGEDGIHLNAAAHTNLGQAIASSLQSHH